MLKAMTRCRHVVTIHDCAAWARFDDDVAQNYRAPEEFDLGRRLHRELKRARVSDDDIRTPCVPLDALAEQLERVLDIDVSTQFGPSSALDTTLARHEFKVGGWSRSLSASGNSVDSAELAFALGRHVFVSLLRGHCSFVLDCPPFPNTHLGADFVELFSAQRWVRGRSAPTGRDTLCSPVNNFFMLVYGLAALALLGVDRRLMAWTCARAEASSLSPATGFTAFFNRSMWCVLKYPNVMELELFGAPLMNEWHEASDAHARRRAIAKAGGHIMRWLHCSLGLLAPELLTGWA
jgi:hypothetical protein